MSSRQRLDEALVARGHYASRSRARDAVLRGTVSVDGETVRKPAHQVGPNNVIGLIDPAQDYVSRAALKLIRALDHFAIDPSGRNCLDLGASTGGFSQVLLARGAAHVTAVDVGHGQMRVADSRLTSIEGLNARDLARAHLSRPVDLVVCDVSFISLTLALPRALALAEPGAELVALVKPQFEVGRAALGKGGIVTDLVAQQRACRDIAAFLEAQGWQVVGLAASPLAGGDGNHEFLLAARKGLPAAGTA